MARTFTMDDFVGFTYNGQHSSLLGIYRVSSGDRYEEGLTPVMTDKTAEVPGGDGQYYFGTTFKSRNFKVDFVFHDLNDTDIRGLKRLFSGDGLHDLIFDETPYKAWSAKVTGTPTLKYIPFDEGDSRIYKGEGSLTFTCYDPFAHTPKKLWIKDTTDDGKIKYMDKDGRILANYDESLYTSKNEWKGSAALISKTPNYATASPVYYQVNGDCETFARIGLIARGLNSGDKITGFRIQKTSTKSETPVLETYDIQVQPFTGSSNKAKKGFVWDTKMGLLITGDILSGQNSPLNLTNTSVVPILSGQSCVKLEPGFYYSIYFITESNVFSCFHINTIISEKRYLADVEYDFIYL